LTVAGTQHYYAIVNRAKGGVLRVFGRGGGALAYEDAGYVVEWQGRRWTSAVLGAGSAEGGRSRNEVRSTTRLSGVKQELLTPGKFLVLRILNLTAFRSRRLGALLRRLIIRKLVTAPVPGPVTLRRSVRFHFDHIAVEDRLESVERMPALRVWLPRGFTPIHMGSAKYFHPQELQPTPEVPVAHLAAELAERGAASLSFEIRFDGTAPGAGPARLVVASTAAPSPHEGTAIISGTPAAADPEQSSVR
jgi:hypothetical protein